MGTNVMLALESTGHETARDGALVSRRPRPHDADAVQRDSTTSVSTHERKACVRGGLSGRQLRQQEWLHQRAAAPEEEA